jgi:hypothetical protein
MLSATSGPATLQTPPRRIRRPFVSGLAQPRDVGRRQHAAVEPCASRRLSPLDAAIAGVDGDDHAALSDRSPDRQRSTPAAVCSSSAPSVSAPRHFPSRSTSPPLSRRTNDPARHGVPANRRAGGETAGGKASRTVARSISNCASSWWRSGSGDSACARAAGGCRTPRHRSAGNCRLRPMPITASMPAGVGLQFDQNAPDLAAIEQDVVRPLQSDAGDAAGLERACHGDANRQRQAGQSRHVPRSARAARRSGRPSWRGQASCDRAGRVRPSAGRQPAANPLGAPWRARSSKQRAGRRAFRQRFDREAVARRTEQRVRRQDRSGRRGRTGPWLRHQNQRRHYRRLSRQRGFPVVARALALSSPSSWILRVIVLRPMPSACAASIRRPPVCARARLIRTRSKTWVSVSNEPVPAR